MQQVCSCTHPLWEVGLVSASYLAAIYVLIRGILYVFCRSRQKQDINKGPMRTSIRAANNVPKVPVSTPNLSQAIIQGPDEKKSLTKPIEDTPKDKDAQIERKVERKSTIIEKKDDSEDKEKDKEIKKEDQPKKRTIERDDKKEEDSGRKTIIIRHKKPSSEKEKHNDTNDKEETKDSSIKKEKEKKKEDNERSKSRTEESTTTTIIKKRPTINVGNKE